MLRRVLPPGGADEAVSCPSSVRLSQFPGPIRLGRHTNCEIRCLSTRASSDRDVVNAAVSRWHAEILRTAAGVYVVKDTSANGTLVNGHKITGTHTLAEGDVITLGMPTYKADASAEVINPFVFNFSSEPGLPARPLEDRPTNPVVVRSSSLLDAPKLAVTPPGSDPLVERATLDVTLHPVLKPREARNARLEVPNVNSGSDIESRVGQHAAAGNAGPVDKDAGRLDQTGAGGQLGTERSSDSQQADEVPESRRRRRLVRGGREGSGSRTEPGTSMSRRLINLNELPIKKSPEATAVASSGEHCIGGPRRQAPPVETNLRGDMAEPAPGVADMLGDSVGVASQDAPASEGPSRVDEGRERVRQRLMEVVRAQARADERQSLFKRRSPESPSAEPVPRPKLFKLGAVAQVTNTGTPISLADDCPLLEVPSMSGAEGGGLRNRGTMVGSSFDPGQSVVIEVPESLDAPANQNAAATETFIVDPPGMGSGAAVPAEPAKAPAAPGEGAAKPSAEAEVLEMLGEEMQCVICQSFPCAAHALPCSHTFCGDCLVQWLSKKPHCPTCRRPTGGASPTPIHNIDSMIERAASKCMSAEEKAEFERRKGVFKTSKKLKPPPASTAAPSGARLARTNRTSPGRLLEVFRSGTLQAVSARLEEAMSGLSEANARDLMRRAQPGNRNMAPNVAPGGPSTRPVPPPRSRQELLPARRDNFGASYVIDVPTAGNTSCVICDQPIAEGRFRLSDTDERSGRKYHLGCVSSRGLVQPYQIAGMDDLTPEAQARARTMLREPGGIFIRSPRSSDQAQQDGEREQRFPGAPRRL